MKTSILFIAPSAYCLGGVQVWLNQLVQGMRQSSRWRVRVGLPAGRHHDLERYLATFPETPAVPLVNPTGSAEGRRRAICELLLQERPDLVVGVNIADLYPAARRARQRGFTGRVLFSLHGLAADLLADIGAEADLLEGVIATNKLSCRLVEEETDVPHERICYAPYGVAISPEHGQRGESFNPLVTTSNPLRIVWVGRLEQEQKRVHDLPSILNHLDALNLPYQLTVAGDGPEKEAISQALLPWIEAGRVRMAGAVSGQEMQELIYPNHHVLLITSRWETGPIVAWEAMAAGLAIVSSAYIGSGSEGALVDGQNCLLFAIGDGEAAARALKRVANPPLREAIVRQGWALVQERYTQAASLQAWEEAFAHILTMPLRAAARAEQPLPPAGRLDRWLGPSLADKLRRRAGFSFPHQSPGGEWPHTAHGKIREDAILERAGEIDAAA